MREYDLIADWYATERVQTVGVAEALAVAATLAPDSLILDVGCGNGVPITKALVSAGHRVVGLDSSAKMLARFRLNLGAPPPCAATLTGVPSQTTPSTPRFRGG
jgi:ubiquinone/menaquinone biosynthesis C-methylase UbiE